MGWEADRLARLRAERVAREGRHLIAQQKAFWLELLWCSAAQHTLAEVRALLSLVLLRTA